MLEVGGNPLDIYLRCASLYGSSIAYHGHTFRLVTNNRALIERRVRELSLAPMDIFQQKFKLRVPENVEFRNAHFKLELYQDF